MATEQKIIVLWLSGMAIEKIALMLNCSIEQIEQFINQKIFFERG